MWDLSKNEKLATFIVVLLVIVISGAMLAHRLQLLPRVPPRDDILGPVFSRSLHPDSTIYGIVEDTGLTLAGGITIGDIGRFRFTPNQIETQRPTFFSQAIFQCSTV